MQDWPFSTPVTQLPQALVAVLRAFPRFPQVPVKAFCVPYCWPMSASTPFAKWIPSAPLTVLTVVGVIFFNNLAFADQALIRTLAETNVNKQYLVESVSIAGV